MLLTNRVNLFRCLVLVALVLSVCIPAGKTSAENSPAFGGGNTKWWDKQKIRFMWGQWSRVETEGIPKPEVIENLAAVGATVFVEDGTESWHHAFSPERVAASRKNGLRHFGMVKMCNAVFAADALKARLAIDDNGRTSFEAKEKGEPGWVSWADWAPPYVACPMDEGTIEEWLVKPALECAENGLDGLHIDWEPYATGFDSVSSLICYCDDCFEIFLKKRGLNQKVEAKDRQKWLIEKKLLNEYLQMLCDRYEEIFRRLAERVRRVKPDFVFSCYGPFFTPGNLNHRWRQQAAIKGLSSPQVPSLAVDDSHYWPHYTCPWWDLYTPDYHALGAKHIIGSFLKGWSAHPATGISLQQYIYESAINSDGTWTWFEMPLNAAEYRVFRAANQRIAAVEQKVGDYLFEGRPDSGFACVVEQSGNPLLAGNVLQRAYHLKESHLVHVSNVNIDRPVTVTLRFSQISPGTKWAVQDPISGLHYLRMGRKPLWSDKELFKGLSVDMEKRSDIWLLLKPTLTEPDVGLAGGVVAEPVLNDLKRPETTKVFPNQSLGGGSLFYLNSRTESEDSYPYYSTVRSSVHAVDMQSKVDGVLFATKGNCWSPAWSAEHGLLAFSCYVNGQGQIYVVGAGRGNVYNASNNAFCDNSPVWSPDGKQIAFVSDRDGDWEIYVMNANGSNQMRLTMTPGMDRAPQWSPDGKRIVFETDRDGGYYDIWMINTDGSGQRPLVQKPGNEREPVWSPDEKQIACTFQFVGDRRSLLITNVNDGSSQAFFEPWGIRYTNLSSLSWSPDGKRIAGAFQGGKNSDDDVRAGLFVINAYASDHKEIVSRDPWKPHTGGEGSGKTLGAGWYCDYSASQRWVLPTFNGISWSPDGKRITFSSDMDESGDFYVYTMPANGGDVTRVETTRSAWEQWCVWPLDSPAAAEEKAKVMTAEKKAAKVLYSENFESAKAGQGLVTGFGWGGSEELMVQAGANTGDGAGIDASTVAKKIVFCDKAVPGPSAGARNYILTASLYASSRDTHNSGVRLAQGKGDLNAVSIVYDRNEGVWYMDTNFGTSTKQRVTLTGEGTGLDEVVSLQIDVDIANSQVTMTLKGPATDLSAISSFSPGDAAGFDHIVIYNDTRDWPGGIDLDNIVLSEISKHG